MLAVADDGSRRSRNNDDDAKGRSSELKPLDYGILATYRDGVVDDLTG